MVEIQAVTGPFSYTGKYIAAALDRRGVSVRGLVRSVPSDPGPVDCRPLKFDDPDRLAADLEGATVLYNTYWIRFERGGMTFARAVSNTGALGRAAARAGVARIVHISVSNPSSTSPFAYFRGKAAAEEAIRASGLPVSIIRPTLVYGTEDILINNMTWLLRRFRGFPLPGGGAYRVQPVFVEDVAALAVSEGSSRDDRTIDAAGPDVLTFGRLLRMLAAAAGVRALLVPVPVSLSLLAGRLLSAILGDVLITPEEIGALMAETLVSSSPPACSTRLEDWLAENGGRLGSRYTSELDRHWSRQPGVSTPRPTAPSGRE